MGFSPYCDNKECAASLFGTDRHYHTGFGDYCSVYCGCDASLNYAPPARAVLVAELMLAVNLHPLDNRRIDDLHFVGGEAVDAGQKLQLFVDSLRKTEHLLGHPVAGVAA